jgi:hypothetical protein
MSADTAPPPQRPRLLSRARLPDLLIAGFLAILAAAIVVNGISDVHDTRRARLDKKVALRWFKSHPELGRFGPPVVKVHQRLDVACAPRRAANRSRLPVDGWCIWIVDRGTKSTGIKRSHRCMVVRPGKHTVRPKGTPACPAAHGNP